MAKKMKVNPFAQIIEQSLAEIQANSDAIEEALSSFVSQEDINITQNEYNELKQLTDTMSELDRILVSIEEAPKAKKKLTKKKATKKRTTNGRK